MPLIGFPEESLPDSSALPAKSVEIDEFTLFPEESFFPTKPIPSGALLVGIRSA
jgi:hypothetical protein